VKRGAIRDTRPATVVTASEAWGRHRLHPATKTVLALRIAVIERMEELGQFPFSDPCHSKFRRPMGDVDVPRAEDRPVKRAFQKAKKRTLRVLTNTIGCPPESSSEPEIRSAKLRMREKV